MAPPSRRRGSTLTGFRMQLLVGARSIAAWSVLYLAASSNSGVHTDIIASLGPQGSQRENRKGEAKEKNKYRDEDGKKGMKGKTHVSAVVVPQYRLTFHLRGGWSRQPEEEQKTQQKVTAVA